jgi:chitinase
MLRAVLTHTATWPLTALALLAILLPIGLGSSQAAYVAQSTNPNEVFSAAASFNTVAVTLTDPGTPLRGVVMLNAVATSSRGMGSVTFESSPAGANTWTTACTASTSPYSCSWDTSTVTDGLRDVRAVATDSAGYTKTDTITNRLVDNTAPSATTTDPGTPLTGTLSVSGSAVDSGSGVASSTLQYRPSGGGSWTNICTAASSIVTCSWNTAALADGLYDLRTTSTDVAGNTGISPIVSNRRLDNIAPTATMTAPAANLTGSVTLASTSADGANGTGVASVRYEYKLSSGSTWTTACTGLTTPFSCSFDTSSAADGLYDFRAVAIDGVAKTGTSAAVTSRRIDNTAPTATMTALAANLSGSVTLASTAADAGSGLASVQYQYRVSPAGAWTNACSSATTPYSCSFVTSSVSDGVYDFRAVPIDNVGISGASAVISSRRIDNTNPTVTMGAVPAWSDASVTLTSTPSDGGGIASVQYQYRTSPAGAWTNACSSATTPYSCSFNTTALINGTAYDYRAIATDNAARTGTSGTVTGRIDHLNPTVTMTSPAAYLAGSVSLASTAADAGSGVASVQYEYKLSSDSTWTTACTSATTPFTCAFDTASVADGLYDFRATATDNVSRTTTSTAVTGRRIDNTNPVTSTLAAVGTNLSGNVNFTGTAADNGGGSGVASWKVQYAPTGTGTWTDLCTDSTTPFGSCTGNVDGLADGIYDFRALVTDLAGNTLGSTVQTNRRVDTDGPVTSVATPANNARVSGNVTMTANASDPAGVASVDFQVFLGGTWFTFCTDNTASYSCTGDSTQVADGTYQTRVVATDSLGHQTISATITLIIDNTHPTAASVNAANGGTAGRIDSGDTLTFTWSEPMAPASILTGWSGGAQPIRIRVNDAGGADTLDLYDATGTTKLNVTSAAQALRLNANWVGSTVWLDGSMTMAGNGIVVTVGSLVSGTINTGVTTTANLQWTSTATTTDVAGNSTTVSTVNETGATDRDF